MGANECIDAKDLGMKIKDGFIVNKVGSQHVVVPVGEASMWEKLGANTTENELVRALLAEYAVDEDTARADVAAFLGKLRDADLLDE